MAHLMSSVAHMSGFEDQNYQRVGVGSRVVYHGRTGHMRQGRTSFPATVLAQNPDDGSLELFVVFEPEDQIWERRVLPMSDTNTGHCWTPVEHEPGHEVDIEGVLGALVALKKQIFGDWQEPPKAVMDYLADFDGQLAERDARLKLIEAKLEAFEGK